MAYIQDKRINKISMTFKNTRSGKTCLRDKELADYGTVYKGNWQSEAVKC